jgi:Ca-activated chloride channel family protein
MLADFHFIQPMWLWLFIPMAVMMILLWRNRVAEFENAGKGIISPHLAKVFSLQSDREAALGPIILTVIGTAILLLSLAGPSFNLNNEKQLKAPLIIALDLSSSMEDRAGTLSHLEQAKLVLDDLLGRGFNRPVSLVAFAGSSHQVLPPSDQLELLKLYLSYLDPSVMPVQGSDINQLSKTVDSIPAAQDFGFDLLLLTDGFEGDVKQFNYWLGEARASGIVVSLTEKAAEQMKPLLLKQLNDADLSPTDDQLYAMVTKLESKNLSREKTDRNVGYWLLYPFGLILLYSFRRGFNLHWAAAILLVVNLTPNTAHAALIDWWLTSDQQGAYYFEKGDFKEAALRFDNVQWKAAAFVQAKQYKKAVEIYRRQDDLTGLYNLATTYTKARNYSKAQALYQLLLEIEPDNADAQKNLAIVVALIEEIKRTSESQQDEGGEQSTKPANPDEMMDSSLGADKDDIGNVEVEIEKLSLDEILASEQKKEQWLRDISRSPKQFLGAKFQAQYNQMQLQDGATNE